MLFCAEGCSLFDDLCLRIDVNQRYASLLPQWNDVAHLLEIDSLRTKVGQEYLIIVIKTIMLWYNEVLI